MNNAVRWTPGEQEQIRAVQEYLQERAGPGRRVTTSEALRWCVARGAARVESIARSRAAARDRKDNPSAD